MTLAAVVHELTHIWQFDNLDYKKMKKEHGLLLVEGHAVWTEIRCLAHRGIGAKYCELQASREDEYGRGYQMVERQLKESGSLNPFVMLKKKYPL